MKNAARLLVIGLSVVGIALTARPAVSATKKKAPAKRVVLGTKQLNGDQAQFGLTYTLGKRDPINVTLDSAEYTTETVKLGDAIFSTKADQKLLVLHYTLHNPNPRDRGIGWSTININAVDADNTNWRYVTNIGMEGTGQKCNMALKPAQKAKVYAILFVPAKGEIPKVIFESPEKLVLRYDLRGKVKGLPAPIADPADATGATALEKVPAQTGTVYTMKELQYKLDSVAYSDAMFQGKAARKGYRYLIVSGTAKNNQPGSRHLGWSTFATRLIDTDGGEIKRLTNAYYMSRDDVINMNLEPGQELSFRYVFEVPEKAQIQSYEIKETNQGRTFVYDVSQVQ